MNDLSLSDYQQAEKALEATRARTGFAVHTVIVAIVSAALIAINIFVASEFPWSPFPVAGMSIRLGFHYYFGIRHLDSAVTDRQGRIERFARHAA